MKNLQPSVRVTSLKLGGSGRSSVVVDFRRSTVFPEVGANRPILLVMNPDIFYYGTFFCYGKLDQVNLATSFYTQFSTIIFDEFHLYDAKQLVSLLFYLSYLHIFGFFQAGRRVILLTATPEAACESALAVLGSQGVRIKKIDGEAGEDRIPSQTAVKLELRLQPERDPFLTEIADRRARRKPLPLGMGSSLPRLQSP